jgi:hypothetical protein
VLENTAPRPLVQHSVRDDHQQDQDDQMLSKVIGSEAKPAGAEQQRQ